jgi:hypothetical protein
MLHEDKSIKRISAETSKELLDPYLLSEKFNTAYVIMVPNVYGGGKADVLASLSTFYPGLCLLKDLVKLSKPTTIEKALTPFKRLTGIPPQLEVFKGDSLHRYLMTQVSLDNLETHFGFN